MSRQLHTAIDSLRKVLNRRQDWKAHPALSPASDGDAINTQIKKAGEMDETAKEYVNNVIQGCERIVDALRHPLE